LSPYYYLVATLPMLFYESERSPSREEFLELCRTQVSQADFRVLAEAGLLVRGEQASGCAVLDKWRSWESGLRNELVKLRARRKGIEPAGHLVEAEEQLGLPEIARQALSETSPLAAEEVLNRARWEYLDQLETGHYFDLARLVLYALRLQLLERRRLLTDRERGGASFQSQYQTITHSIREEPA
jgi:hypothetical protein